MKNLRGPQRNKNVVVQNREHQRAAWSRRPGGRSLTLVFCAE